MFTSLRILFRSLRCGLVLSFILCEAVAQQLAPADVGTVLNGYQDDFDGTALNPAWVAAGAALGNYSLNNGILHVATAAGDPNHLLYAGSAYDGAIQEVLARIRVTSFGTGDASRGGIGVGVNRSTSQGINYHFRDVDSEGQTGRHTSFLDDSRAWGPGNAFKWQDNIWYWMRLRQEPNAGGNTSDVFAKIWPADGSTPEPSTWQTWDYIPTRTARTGLAGITAGSAGGIAEFDVDYILIKAGGLPAITVAPAAFPVFKPGPVIFVTQPRNTTALPCSAATFAAVVDGTPPYTFQWYRNGVLIPGATSASLTVNSVQLADNGARYQLVASNTVNGAQSSATSTEAILTVTPDTAPLTLVSAGNTTLNSIQATFSQAVTSSSASDASHYSITSPNGPLAIVKAELLPDQTNVVLTTTGQVQGIDYLLGARNVVDQCTGQNSVSASTLVHFSFQPLSTAAIGGAAGAIAGVTGGFDLTGSGIGLKGTSDQFEFAYQARSGNFDVKVRIASLAGSDPWAEVGLVARDGQTASAPFAGVLATPGISGTFFKSRLTAGASVVTAGSFPVNYPNTWLRLRRAGNRFTGYASLDGENWRLLGSTDVTLPSSVSLGFALASRSTLELSAASIRDFADISGSPASFSAAPDQREPMGQSSRTTSLILSEIMYRPGTWAGTNTLEFVELFNTLGTPEDISGYRIDGDIHFRFPAGTVLAPGAYLVIAKAPADVQRVYGITNVTGPYTGKLPNDSGKLQLRSHADAILLEVNYRSEAPWPVSPDGTGHSLVLARPSLGEAHAAAWAASDARGGSPGRLDPFTADPLKTVVINEILAHTDDPELDFIELYNRGKAPVDISGSSLSDEHGTNKFIVPAGTILQPGAFAVFNQTQLGFSLEAAGETVFFGNAIRCLDAVRFGAQANSVSFGRIPDGGEEWRPLAAKSAGARNSGPRLSDIVINEIMYSPISRNDDDQYVELYNRGQSAVSLAGWRLVDAIDFTFPPNSALNAGEYLVIARNADRLRSNYSNLNAGNLVGNFSGKLSGSGERIALAMPDTIVTTNASGALQTNLIHVVVNEVTYGRGGQWGQWSARGGSSLELIHPDADNTRAMNWADSDETRKAGWTTISRTGVLDNGSYAANNQLQVILQGAGECLIDDVEVLNAAQANVVTNSNFEIGSGGWFAEGSMEGSSLETGEGFNSAQSYHIRAVERGDNQPNRVRTKLRTTLPGNSSATIRAKVRWMKGAPTILLRLLGNWLELAGDLNVPANLGTPGARNSRYLDNPPPAISGVVYSPILPAAGEPVTVTARVDSPVGVASVELLYRLDPATAYNIVRMVDDGTGGDARAGDGIYSARIPGQAAGTLAAFYVAAADLRKVPSNFPKEAPAREWLVRFGEIEPSGNFPVYRMWMTQATLNKWNSRNKLNNAPLPVTFVLGNQRVIQGATALYAGSPFIAPGYAGATASRCAYSVNFPDDDQFLGSSVLVLDWPGGHGNETTAMQEQLGYWIADRIGLPYCHRYTIRLHVNGVTDDARSAVFEAVNQPSGDFIKAWSPGADNPDFYKIDAAFEFDDSNTLVASPSPMLQVFNTTGGVKKLEKYRWNWSKRASDDENNYTNIFKLADALASTTALLTANTEPLVDTEEWMGIFAVEHMINNFDSWGHDIGKNMYAYKSDGRKWQIFMFDLDWLMLAAPGGPGAYTASTGPLFNAQDPAVVKMFNNPPWRRAYFRAVQAALDGPFLAANYEAIMDAKYQSLVANGIRFCDNQALTAPTTLKKWFADRRTYLLAQVSKYKAPFSIDPSVPTTTTSTDVTITGGAPIDVKTITINGVPWPVTWTGFTNWTLHYTVRQANSQIVLGALDRNGLPISSVSNTLSITYTGPALTPPAVFINEWMAANTRTLADRSGGAAKYDDWFELYNAGAEAAALDGYYLTDDLANKTQFQIPAGYAIPPGGRLLVWADGEPEQNSPTNSALHVNFQLSAKGESIGLFSPDGVLVDSVTFGSQTDDVSQGRCPDGSRTIVSFDAATPGGPNNCSTQSLRLNLTRVGDTLTLSWQSVVGARYRLEYKDDLAAPAWTAAGADQPGNGALLQASLAITAAQHRFFRISFLLSPE